MTPYQERRLSPVTKRMAEDMLVRNMAQSTIDAYTYHVENFLRHADKTPEEIGPEEVRLYQLHLIQERKVGFSSFNQAVCGLRFLYRITLPRTWHVKMIPFGKRPKKIPAVLGDAEVQELLQCVPNLKHRTVLLVCYAAGLRLAEATHLKVADIDSQRMQLRVARGKGAKERLVPISPRLLTALRIYWKQFQPPNYLFPGKTSDTPLAGTTIQKACKQASKDAGIRKNITPHSLRHSFATALLEAGVDLLTIGRLLGHTSFTSTMIYLHVRKTHLDRSPSPIDWLPIRQCPQWMETEAPRQEQKGEQEQKPKNEPEAGGSDSE